jgi:uracil DNA glycosylase
MDLQTQISPSWQPLLAPEFSKLINTNRHTIIQSGHPSPLSAAKFFGSKPFSKINMSLEAAGKTPIDWRVEKP